MATRRNGPAAQPRKPRASASNALTMGPDRIVTQFKQEQEPRAPSPIMQSSPRRSTRVQQLQTPGKGGVRMLGITPNSSTLPVSPAGSSPGASRVLKKISSLKFGGFANSPNKKVGHVSFGGGLVFGDRSGGALGFSVQEGETEDFEDDEDDEGEDDDDDWGIVDRMRLWRHDAMTQHLYETAIFWGDKILTWTNDPNDAFWLAQVHFQIGQYARAERLLTRPFPAKPTLVSESTSTLAVTPAPYSLGGIPPVSSSSLIKGKGKAHTLTNLQSDSGFFLSGMGGLPKVTVRPPVDQFDASFDGDESLRAGLDLEANDLLDPDEKIRGGFGENSAAGNIAMMEEEGLSQLVNMSLTCRYLAARCQYQLGKWSDAIELLGKENPFRQSVGSGAHIRNEDGGIKLEASMCFLRGQIYLRLSRGEKAKEAFLEALALDVKCFEAFNLLVQNQMLTIDEEWALTQGLNYEQQAPEDAEFLRMMYTIRLKKLKHRDEIALARNRLTKEFGLGDNCDLLYTLADSLYNQFRWADCFAVTSRIMELSGIHTATLPLHIACMYHLKHLHSRLFILAHELVDKEPDLPMSWLAVGVWYLISQKWRDARQYLSKATIMNPRLAPGWIAFAHTFALEGEHEHAITAYSTAARLFPGTHLPYLFIGMEQLTLSQITLAEASLNAAEAICDLDPLVHNEKGVVAYSNKDYRGAVECFRKTLELAKIIPGSETNWTATFCNLGAAHRKLSEWAAAEEAYQRVLEIEPRHATALASLGMVFHMREEYTDAIQKYHEALSLQPLDTNVLELLNMALISEADRPKRNLPFDETWAAATDKRPGGLMRSIAVADDKGPVGWDFAYGGVQSAWSM